MSKFLSFLNVSNAFRFYPLSASAWIIWVIFIDCLVMGEFKGDTLVPLFCAFIVLLILTLEQSEIFTPLYRLNKIIIFFSCVFILAFGLWYVAKSFSEFGSFLLVLNFILVCLGIFTALRVKSYEDFYANVGHFVFPFLLLILWSILFLIFLATFEFLFFSFNRVRFLFWSVGLGVIGLVFLSKKAPKFEFNNRLNLLFLILNCFAWLYALMLLFYFTLIFIGFPLAKYSVVHLVIWFGNFGLVLTWVNFVCEKKNFFNTKGTKIFLAMLLVLSLIALGAILIRIHQYALTPNRIYVVLLALYLCAGVILSFYKNLSKTLWLFALLAFLAGILAIPLSIYSQKTELKTLENLEKRDYEKEKDILYFLKKFANEEEEWQLETRIDELNRLLNKERFSNQEKTTRKFETIKIRLPKKYYGDINIKGYDKFIFDDRAFDGGYFSDIKLSFKYNTFLIKKYRNENLDLVLLEVPKFDKVLLQMEQDGQNEIEFKGELGYKFKLLLDSAAVIYTYQNDEVVDTRIDEIFGFKLLIKESEKSKKKIKR